MITAEEFLNKDYFYIVIDIRDSPISPTDISQAMIEFAKLHVEAALKQASEKVDWREEPTMQGIKIKLKKSSILNAYSLEQIK